MKKRTKIIVLAVVAIAILGSISASFYWLVTQQEIQKQQFQQQQAQQQAEQQAREQALQQQLAQQEAERIAREQALQQQLAQQSAQQQQLAQQASQQQQQILEQQAYNYCKATCENKGWTYSNYDLNRRLCYCIEVGLFGGQTQRIIEY